MTVSEYIACYLNSQGVNDVFGIPGGVILDLMYAFDAHNAIDTHLCYHEQCAGFAACGYAQVKDTVGVAYATKGPGFTNLITAIADAYYDSIPVVFITAHTAKSLPEGCRVVTDQDMDTCGMVRDITKYAKRVDYLEEIPTVLKYACEMAKEGRKGPVFLDFASNLLKQEIRLDMPSDEFNGIYNVDSYVNMLCNNLREAKRPVILIGDGINQTFLQPYFCSFSQAARIPVISSRYSHNIEQNVDMYYGYVGSHGIRYANFILSKADVIVTLGNRLNFPSSSESYGGIAKNATFIRFDVDGVELYKHPYMNAGYKVDLRDLLPALSNNPYYCGNHDEWKATCDTIRRELWDTDVNDVVLAIGDILQKMDGVYTIVSDVGNNEFWVSRACVHSKNTNRVLHSKSFGALGNAIGKAIGAYYATHSPVVVFVGDQGFQMNIQELQYIAQHNLPITIVLLNNHSSGMIKDREKAAGYSYCLHTTLDSGYGVPDFSKIAKAYGIEYHSYKSNMRLNKYPHPQLIEVNIPDSVELTPSLPRGRDCQDMEPRIDNTLYNRLNQL